MTRFLYFFVFVCIFISCAKAPQIYEEPQRKNNGAKICKNIFPRGKWKFVHKIKANLSNGAQMTMIGITITDSAKIDLAKIDSAKKKIRAALMTIEGFLLFEGELDGENLIVKRAVPPFDSPGFAKGLMDDIMLMFFLPEYVSVKTGFTKDGKKICRYFGDNGDFTDILILKNGWEIYKYKNNSEIRKITAYIKKDKTQGFTLPEIIRLIASGSIKYSLGFKLIEAEKISGANGQIK